MATKKQPTRKDSAQQQPPAYGSLNSFPLTDEQIKRLLAPFGLDLLADETNELAANLLVLLRSFTYTEDYMQREYMLNAAEEALAPSIVAVQDLLTKLAIE